MMSPGVGYPEWFDDVDQLIHERPHPADEGPIRYRRCILCCCDTRAQTLACLVARSKTDTLLPSGEPATG